MGTEIRDLMPGELVYSLFRYENVNEGISLKNRPRPDKNQNILPSRQIIIDRISKDVINALKNGQKIKHFLLRSNFGVGKSYVLENIVTKCVNCKIDGANVLHFAVNKECGLESMYQMFSAVGFSLDLVKESAVLERKSNTTQREKAIIKIMRKIQLISVDDAHACSWEIWNFLSKVSKEQSLKTVMLGSASLLQKLQDDQSIRYFEIPELTSKEAEAWIREHRGAEKGVEIKLDKEGSISYNPVCLLLRMKIQALPGIHVSIAVNDSLEDILTKVFRTLPSAELYLLSQFALCRKPIPLKSERDVENFIRLGLVQLKKGERCNSIVLQPCIKVLVSKMINKENLEVDGQQKKDFSVIALWRNLLHPKLQELLTGAEQRKWPYIPEPWQFTEDVNEEDRYNLRDLLNKSNEYSEISPMREFDVLQECLYHALIDGDYIKASAVAFLVDRYAFWQGDSSAIMAIVDFIVRVSPDTPIAPQILTRKARVRKNDGDLQGSARILDSLIDNEKKARSWYYRDTAEYLIVKAASTELKGSIFHGLGLWYEAASSFMSSTGLFRSFQKPDKKGLAAGLALLADTLQFMPDEDFKTFSRQFELPTEHALLEAIRCATEAAKYCVHTPLFYAKNKRRAGEFSLAYAIFLDEKEKEEEKWAYLRNAAFEILEGLKCHTSINRLESREQYFEFVSCIYKISQICRQLFKGGKNNSAEIFEKLAVDLFEHYCSYPIKVKHNEKTVALINRVLRLLKLPELPWTDILQTSGKPDVSIELDKEKDEDKNTGLIKIGEELKSVDVSAVYNEAETAESTSESRYENRVKEERFITGRVIDEELDEKQREMRKIETVLSSVGSKEANLSVTQDEFGKQTNRDHVMGFRNQDTLNSVESILESAGSVERSSGFRNTATLITEEDELRSVESTDTGYRSATTESTSDARTNDEQSDNQGVRSDGDSKPVVSRVLRCYTTADNETVEERNWRVASTAGTLEDVGTSRRVLEEINREQILETRKNKVKKAMVWRYDPIIRRWNSTETLACVGDKLDFGKSGGACRDAYNFEHLHQDDPYGRYVGKQYKLEKYKDNPKSIQQYKQDIICQTTARYYVTLFNQRLYDKIKGEAFSQIQYLPTVLVELTDVKNDPERYFNVEPYMFGNFEKITNNAEHVTEREIVEKDLLLAFSHFTYFASNGELLLVDIQGWTSEDKKGFHYLTDPQIHTRDKRGYGTGNLGQRGFDDFWLKQHEECNGICNALGLRRPQV